MNKEIQQASEPVSKTMKYFRYWLATQLIEWGVRLLPDEYTRSRMALGMQWAADLINQELAIEDEHERDQATDHDLRT